MARVIKIK